MRCDWSVSLEQSVLNGKEVRFWLCTVRFLNGSLARLVGKPVPMLALEMRVSEVRFASGTKNSSENAESAVDSI